MVIAINNIDIRVQDRVGNGPGLVIADFFFADHTPENPRFERCIFAATNGQDALTYLQSLIPGKELGRRDNEIRKNIFRIKTQGKNANVVIAASTVAENASALREEYQSATELEAIFIGDYLQGLNNNQIGNAFGISNGQVTTLRNNKLIPARNAADAIRAEVGA